MRIPLGILSGMGFLGAGAILKRGDLVLGVTTAATLWFVTILGLCFGSGEMWLGLGGLALGGTVLWGLRWLESFLSEEHLGTLELRLSAGGPSREEVESRLQGSRYRAGAWNLTYGPGLGERTLTCEVRWQARRSDTLSPGFVEDLAHRQGVSFVEWRHSYRGASE
jgi:putative Mg2+ transporter-C (MgtC) family protein